MSPVDAPHSSDQAVVSVDATHLISDTADPAAVFDLPSFVTADWNTSEASEWFDAFVNSVA
jgi:hypothetical protein